MPSLFLANEIFKKKLQEFSPMIWKKKKKTHILYLPRIQACFFTQPENPEPNLLQIETLYQTRRARVFAFVVHDESQSTRPIKPWLGWARSRPWRKAKPATPTPSLLSSSVAKLSPMYHLSLSLSLKPYHSSIFTILNSNLL